MNIDYELYRVFYVVASNGNITKAAEELNISQPAISKSIKNLESQLGGELFIRTKRGVVLTLEGKEFYSYIKQAIEITRNAESRFTELKNLEVGVIRIGASTTLTKMFLLPFIEEFHRKHPKIEIQIITNISGELLNKLRNGLLDLVFINSSGEGKEDDMDYLECSKLQDVFVVNNSYKDLINKKVSIIDVIKYPLVLLPKGSKTRDYLDNFVKTKKIVLKPSMELAGYSLVIEFAKMGLGATCVPLDYVKKEIANRELYKIDLKEKIPSRGVFIVTSKRRKPSFSAKKFIEIVLGK